MKILDKKGEHSSYEQSISEESSVVMSWISSVAHRKKTSQINKELSIVKLKSEILNMETETSQYSCTHQWIARLKVKVKKVVSMVVVNHIVMNLMKVVLVKDNQLSISDR